MKKTAYILFLTIFAKFAFAQVTDSSNVSLLFGRNHAYYLTAPAGWIIDREAGKEEGLNAVVYPKKETWASAETAMYTHWVTYDTTKNEKFNDVINFDIMEFEKNSKNIKIKKEKAVKIDKTKTAIIYTFTDETEKFYERVAYIQEKKGAVLIVLTSRTLTGIEDNNATFIKLILSYSFLTDKVNFH